VGIEVTRIFYERARAAEEVRRNVLSAAREIAGERGLAGVHVDVCFTESIKRRHNALEIADVLVNRVLQCVPLPELTRRIRCPHVAISNITIYRVGGSRQSWAEGEGVCVNESFTRELQDIIQRKERRIPSYAQRFNSLWLLVVADFDYAAGHYSISDAMLPWQFETMFDRLFFFERLTDVATVLK
jgi:hypothetical protein